MSGKENIIPQSTAILDGAKRLVSLDLADDTGIDSILAGDSLQLDQRCPSNVLEKAWYMNNQSLVPILVP
jgi:hypothetical protein